MTASQVRRLSPRTEREAKDAAKEAAGQLSCSQEPRAACFLRSEGCSRIHVDDRRDDRFTMFHMSFLCLYSLFINSRCSRELSF